MFQNFFSILIKLTLLTIVSLGSTLFASEIDSLTDYDKIMKLPNSYPALNKFVRFQMKKAVTAANKRLIKKCSIKRLKFSMVQKLSSNTPVVFPSGDKYKPSMSFGWGGVLETSINKGKDKSGKFKFPIMNTKRKLSIYQDITWKESIPMKFVLGNVVRVEYKRLGKTFNLIIGSDKFGHWIGQGYEYHLRTKENYKELQKAVDHGYWLENTILGLKASGIFSYGDLAANMMGMVFWDNLIDEDGKTPYVKMTRPKGPYVKCVNNKWVINKKHTFDFKDYISPAWDETINYSYPYSKVMADKIKKRILNLQNKYKRDFTPPLRLDYCISAVDFIKDQFPYHFLPVSRQVINPICRTAYIKRQKQVWSNKNWLVEGEITDYMEKLTRQKYRPKAPNEKWIRKNGL